jgi:hypothetical protein
MIDNTITGLFLAESPGRNGMTCDLAAWGWVCYEPGDTNDETLKQTHWPSFGIVIFVTEPWASYPGSGSECHTEPPQKG